MGISSESFASAVFGIKRTVLWPPLQDHETKMEENLSSSILRLVWGRWDGPVVRTLLSKLDHLSSVLEPTQRWKARRKSSSDLHTWAIAHGPHTKPELCAWQVKSLSNREKETKRRPYYPWRKSWWTQDKKYINLVSWKLKTLYTGETFI